MPIDLHFVSNLDVRGRSEMPEAWWHYHRGLAETFGEITNITT
jgi:hypothetical protein